MTKCRIPRPDVYRSPGPFVEIPGANSFEDLFVERRIRYKLERQIYQ